jgi:heptosyltransferase-1
MRVGHGIDLLGTIARIIPERNPPATDRSRLRTFLIIKLSSIGDVVHALPVASALRQRFPSARISWVTEEWTAPLVVGHPAVDRVIVFPTMVRWPARTSWWVRRFKNAARELRSERYDVALDLQGLARSAMVTTLSRSSLRIARSGQREGSHLVSYGVTLPRRSLHAVDEYLHVAASLGANAEHVTFNLPVHGEARRSVASLLSAYGLGSSATPIVINPSSVQPWKRWSAASWAVVLDALSTLGPVVIMGSDADRRAHAAIVRGAARMPIDLTGQTTLAEAVALLDRASLHVAPDTGTVHIAAALGTPVVCVYGPTEPRRVGPYGQPAAVVHHRDRCGRWCPAYCHRGRACLGAVTPAEVIAKAREVLDR